MASIAVYYCLFLLFCFGVLEGYSACDHINYTTINNIRRSTAYNATAGLCDRGFIKDGSWYRFQSDAGDKMPEFNPGIKSCGTFVPIWLKGNHPSTVGVEVDRMACAPLPHAYPFDCGLKYDIKVINCGRFFLYQLKEPSTCNIAYCAGTKLGKGCSIDGSSIPVCSGVVPSIMRPKVRPKDEDRVYVALQCFWDYFDDASHVEFHVKWFKDSNETTYAMQHTFNGTANQTCHENLYEKQIFVNRVTGKIERDERGYEWNKRVYCKVRGRFHGGGWSQWKSSGTIFTGIEVHPRTIYLDECETNREIFVSLRPVLPIRKTSYKFEIGYEEEHQNTLAKICIRGRISSDRCLSELTERHNFYHPLWIRITAVCPSIETGESLKEVKVRFHNQKADLTNNLFWYNYDFLPIKVTMASRKTKLCKSLTDPNIETFDGRAYNPLTEGTFRLYLNRLSGTEVQARLDTCCNCGVAIKEGYYFKIVELCSSRHQTLPNIRSSHHPDMPKNGFYVERTSDELTIGQENIVHMPSGITVTIKRRLRSFDIIIKAPEPYSYAKRPEDKHRHSEGLCGNYNGDLNDDFEGLTMSEFAETHRIQPGSSEDIFAYMGNEAEEKMMYEECKEDDICVCRHGDNAICNSPETINECSPPEQNSAIQNLHGDICRGGRTTRNDDTRKRAIDMRDDDIDDQDIIPLYNPPKRNLIVPSWPTPSGLTKKNVTSLCNKRIRYSKAGESCSNVNGVNLDSLVNQCITDIQFTDDPSWAVANAGALNTVCKKNVYKNISYYKNSTDGILKLETNILDSLCPNDCSDRGNCSNSTCTCFEDYTAADCSISLKDSPKLYGIRKSGLCDVRRRPCRNVGIYAFPLLDSANLTCHVQEIKVIESVWDPDSSITLFPGLMMDITEVKCFLPESPVNIGDYGNEGVAAAGIKIAVSNNRINASKESLLFITYDSVCQECNVSTGCQLKADACSISGHCFAKNDSHPDDWCRQCLPNISISSWENRTDNKSPKFNISKTFYAFLGKELRVQLDAIDPENRTIRYSFTLQNTSLGASLTENGFFSWTTKTNVSEVFMFKVTDECGAYSSVNASVAIKDCPCKNKGECFPDYRYLDGAGNFTCSCPVEYTGVLCENDVNECSVSEPCFNGTCNNEIPGFSCSCFAGYTGHFCQAEIDECAYQPCFPGILCTDLIDSFSCGPCPKGYTGNGKNCTRIDGKVDECVRNPEVCHKNSSCEYNNGSYACQCIHGYSGDGKNNCTDVNECLETSDICHKNATCTNIEGSYSCQCLKGFIGDGRHNCSDVNECLETPDICHKNATCTNIEGSYSCHCLKGLIGDGRHNCSDVNECVKIPDVCHKNATCINIEGNYTCECLDGFIGDGYHDCFENKPPLIKTPSSVYAILNMDFKIQIEARDPEDEDLVFEVMSNGTLTTAEITENGFLTIPELKESGSVYILVKDKKNAQNFLVLNVKAMQCQCEQNGKCQKKQNVTYPVKRSDYICRCNEPFAGEKCEKRSNPCREQPCFPGLKCSSALNSEGFTCEKCPPLFKGDGKYCELNNVKDVEKSHVESKMTLKSEEWDDKLMDNTSKEYRGLASRITIEIRTIYNNVPGFSYVIVKNFRPGSIIVNFMLIFSEEVKAPLEALLKVAETGKLGNMTFEMNVNGPDVEDDKNGSMNETIRIAVIIAGVVVLLFLIILIVVLRVRRQRKHREEELRKKQRAEITRSQPKGISYKGKAGEEMDMKEMEFKASCVGGDLNIEP